MSAPTPLRRRLVLPLLFGVAGLLVNLLRYEIFFNVDLIFGSVFVMLVILHAGEGPGVVAALIAGSATWILWNHPWAVVILAGEALFVGWLVRRRSWDLLLADLLFWGALGIPLIWGFYHLLLRTPVQTTALVFLKQAINGIINALLACILHLAWRARSHGSGAVRPAFRSVVFVTTVSLVTFPALLFLTVFVRQEVRRGQQDMIRQSAALDLVGRQMLQTWIEDRHQSIATLASLASQPNQRREDLQRTVEAIRTAMPAFKRAGVLDVHADVIVFSPLVDDLGRSTLGRNFSDRPYIPTLRQSLKPWVADIVMGRVGRPEPVISLVVPVVRDGRYDGYCIGIVDATQIQEVLAIIAGSADARLTLLDRSGRVVASTRKDLAMMSPFAPPPGERRPLGEGVWHVIPPAQPGHSTMQRWSESFLVQEGLLSQHLPWKLVVESPQAPVISSLSRITIRGLGTLLLLILLTIALAHLLSRGFTAAIARLEEATRAFPGRLGEDPGTDLALPPSRIKETQHLNDRFQQMTDALRVSFRELNDLKDTLEQRVTLRTQELQTALDTIKTLHGIIPICASCKKIRDDKGSWNQLETYISEHTEADFSHGICPECARKLYPEVPRADPKA
ncbi:MAG TPA: cache domain-containing protein [Geothrix sp.]|uniref:cache domain-containing protein n=1 Tax=Geothrix mesophila TaxID=2922723 RepID=UPI001FAB8177|nr:cache domain-containing protein [Geothrix sp. SG198]HJV38269.1 cache domain-containing protein [Geothrix sp.]